MADSFLNNYCLALVVIVVGIPSRQTSAQSVGVPKQKRITNSINMTLAEIKPGFFMMGSPGSEAERGGNETQHKVTLTKKFFMGATHVTRASFATFVNGTGYRTDAEKRGWALAVTGERFQTVNGASWRNPGHVQGENHPVVEVSWNDARAFCQWLSRKEGKKYRLPSEAEWEYCCRAGAQAAFPWGNNPDDGKGWANCADATLKEKWSPNGPTFNWADGEVFTSPVGKFKPNPWGLYDMIGNASQWCSDRYAEYPNGDSTDPQGPPEGVQLQTSVFDPNGSGRVLRGGSWFHVPRGCRCAVRINMVPDGANFFSSFRVVLEAE